MKSIKVVCVLVLVITLCACQRRDHSTVIFQDITHIEYEQDLDLSCLIQQINQYTVDQTIREDNRLVLPDGSVLVMNANQEPIDLGTINFCFTYKQQKFYKQVTIVDTTAPDIQAQENYEVENGNTYFKLLNEISCSDNHTPKEAIEISMNGDYDLSKDGQYTVEIIAYDQSKNYARKQVTVHVFSPQPTEESAPYPANESENQQAASNSSNENPSNNTGTTDNHSNQPSSRFYDIKDYGTFDACMNACYQDISGHNGVCTPVKDDNGTYIGYQSIYE